MNATQLASWENRLAHVLADPHPDPEALHLLFGEMVQALAVEREARERVVRLAALRCVQLQPDLRALTRYEDMFMEMAPGRVMLPADGLGALLRGDT